MKRKQIDISFETEQRLRLQAYLQNKSVKKLIEEIIVQRLEELQGGV